jgi:hypothetical protein
MRNCQFIEPGDANSVMAFLNRSGQTADEQALEVISAQEQWRGRTRLSRILWEILGGCEATWETLLCSDSREAAAEASSELARALTGPMGAEFTRVLPHIVELRFRDT